MAGTHGVAGKIKVVPHSGEPSGLLAVRRVRLRRTPAKGADPVEREFAVRTAQRLGGCAVFALNGVESVEAAKEWAGARVFIPRDELPPPGEDEYYHADLVGCAVVTQDGAPLGVVAGVVAGAAHDWLALRRAGEKEEFLLPIVKAFIVAVDVAGRRIVAAPPPGWPHAD